MIETYFRHYVLQGGWAMLLLVPASVVAVASILRCILAYRAVEIVPGGTPARETSQDRVLVRIGQIRNQFGNADFAQVQQVLHDEVVYLFSMLQPLVFVYVCAPMAGLLGSLTRLMDASLELGRGGGVDVAAVAVERALVPLLWGMGIGLASYAAFFALRLRLYFVERNMLRPGVETALGQRIPANPVRRVESVEAAE